MKRKKKKIILSLAIIGCILLIYVCTVMGAASVSLEEVNRILLHAVFRAPVSMEGISQGTIAIVRDVRLPRVLLGFLTGAALAVCGASYQGIFKNPMADPYIPVSYTHLDVYKRQHVSIRQSITYGGEPPELKHLSRARKRKKIYRFPK